MLAGAYTGEAIREGGEDGSRYVRTGCEELDEVDRYERGRLLTRFDKESTLDSTHI